MPELLRHPCWIRDSEYEHLLLEHLVIRSVQSGDWKKETMSREEFMRQVIDKINQVDIDHI